MHRLSSFVYKRKFLSAVATAVIVGLVLGLIFVSPAASAGVKKKTVLEQGWSYELRIKNGSLEDVAIDFNFKDAKAVEDYAAAMRRENEKLFKSGTSQVVAAPLVFKRAISWEEADAFVKKHRIYVSGYDFRLVARDDADHRYTFGTGLLRDGKNLKGFSDTDRERFEEYIARVLPDRTVFKGIIGMQATLDANEYQRISTDADLYLVDMPGQIVNDRLEKKALAELKNVDTKGVDLPKGSPQLYRKLEDFNLVKK